MIDEADVFFLEEKNFEAIKKVSKYKHIKNREEGNKVQWILFSATYPEGQESILDKVQQRIKEIVDTAQ